MTPPAPLQISRLTDRTRQTEVEALEAEYFAWVTVQLAAEFQIRLDTDRLLLDDMTELDRYFPPTGGLFLAEIEGDVVGMIFLTQLQPGIGQLRRMYVRATVRRRGVARVLFETAVQAAREAGYAQLRLESPKSWAGAHALYHELGFAEVPMSLGSEVPEPLQPYWIFMQRDL
jgi:GNAT superfamily N-acetyltransferase